MLKPIVSNSISIPVTTAIIPIFMAYFDAVLARSRWPSSHAKSTWMKKDDNNIYILCSTCLQDIYHWLYTAQRILCCSVTLWQYPRRLDMVTCVLINFQYKNIQYIGNSLWSTLRWVGLGRGGCWRCRISQKKHCTCWRWLFGWNQSSSLI